MSPSALGGLLDEAELYRFAHELVEVPGITGVVIGGSRARGTHRPDSDVDLGVYYRGDFGGETVAALRALAERHTGQPTDIAVPGNWGPWVNGGAWLTIRGQRVDWILRDLDRVERIWQAAQRGAYEVGAQTGHPLGFYSFAYAGELATSRVLADPTGALTALHAAVQHYPPALGDALAGALWEVDLALYGATSSAAGGDVMNVAGLLVRLVGVLCHALHGRAGAWLMVEKGMVAATGRLPIAPADFASRAQRLLGALGVTRAELEATIADAAALAAEVRAAVGDH